MLKNLKKSLVVFGAVASIATADVITTEMVMPTVEITTNLLQLPQNLNLGGLFATPWVTIEADIDLSITRLTYDLSSIYTSTKISNYAVIPRSVLGVRHYFNNSSDSFYIKAGTCVLMESNPKVETAESEEDFELLCRFFVYCGFGHKFQITNRVSMSNSVEVSKEIFQTSKTIITGDVQKYDNAINKSASSRYGTWDNLKANAQFRLLNLEIRVL